MSARPPEVKIVTMPEGIKDTSDLFGRNPRRFNRAFRRQVARAVTPPLGDPIPTANPPEQSGFDARDDIGFGRRFAKLFSDQVRWCPGVGWLWWDGRRWLMLRKDVAHLVPLAAEAVQSLLNDAPRDLGLEAHERLAKIVAGRMLRPRIEASIEFAKSFLIVRVSQLDANPFALNCLNGTIDLRTGKLCPHDPNDLITKLVAINFDPRAKAPRFRKFLKEIFANDAATIDFI